MTLRSFAAALVAASLLPSGPATAKKKADQAAAWTLPDESPAPSAKELVRRFPGAPAVVVLDAVEHRWTADLVQVTTLQRRVRLLDQTAAEIFGRQSLYLPQASETWTPMDGRARLVDPEGNEKATREPSVDAVSGGLRVSASFPEAAAGDLIEIVQRASVGAPAYPPWLAQGPLPVLESRVLALPPPIVTLRAYGSALPTGSLEPEQVEVDDAEGAGWRFRELPALRTGLFAPAPEQASGRLLLAVERYPDPESGAIQELDWSSWAGLAFEGLRRWVDTGAIGSLRGELGDEPPPARVLESLRERLRVERTTAFPDNESAAEALKAGRGSSADLALLAASVLGWPEAEGVDLVAARPWDRGPVVTAAPVDGNFTELLVRAGEVWLDPSPGGTGGELPPRLLGTQALTLRSGATGPVALEERRAEDARTQRRARLALSPEGRLSGSLSVERSPLAASLAPLDPAEADGTVDRPGWGRREGSRMSFGVLPWRLFQELDLSGEPPEGELDLGWPRLVVDSIAVDLPPGVTGAKLCAPATIDAGPAGRYERSVKPEGRTVTVTRTFRLDVTRFGPEEAGALFEWLRRIQEAERAETVLQLE